MLIGYARATASDDDSVLQDQVRDLTAAGCEDVFCDRVSALSADRPDLERALRFVRKGDALVVTDLDRLAVSMTHLMEIEATLQAKSAELRIVSMGLDTATPTGRLMLHVLDAVAGFERSVRAETQRSEGRSADGRSERHAASEWERETRHPVREERTSRTEPAPRQHDFAEHNAPAERSHATAHAVRTDLFSPPRSRPYDNGRHAVAKIPVPEKSRI